MKHIIVRDTLLNTEVNRVQDVCQFSQIVIYYAVLNPFLLFWHVRWSVIRFRNNLTSASTARITGASIKISYISYCTDDRATKVQIRKKFSMRFAVVLIGVKNNSSAETSSSVSFSTIQYRSFNFNFL